MVKRTLVVLAALALAVVGLAPTASATGGEADIGGTGSLWARGTGTAAIDGGGTVRMAIEGDVFIVDNAGDARVWIGGGSGGDGDELAAQSSVFELDGFRGVIRVTGSDFEIEAEGRMRFRARGTGTVFLQGTGIYRTCSDSGRWNQSGVRLELGSLNAAA